MKIKNIPQKLADIRREDRFRAVHDLRMITASRGVDRSGKEYIVFNSNDYLGMTHEKEVEEAARNAVIYGTGSGGARLTSGAVFELSDLEKEIARTSGKLNNKGFLAKAPEAVVQKEKDKLAEFEEKMNSLNERLKFLQQL